MAAEDDILELRAIGHSFGGLAVLRSVSFSVPRGGLIGLIGPNGSGKTTLFNIVSGFFPQNSGAVIYRGRELKPESVPERSRAGLVRTFQTPKLFEQMTVYENVLVGCCKLTRTSMTQDLFGTPHARNQLRMMAETAREACAKFGLSTIRDELAKNLTAGRRRLVEIARAVVGRPQLLLLDEPSAGLNSDEIKSLQQWLRQLKAEGISILLVSHDMELMTVSDLVHVLNFGEIVASGDMAAIQRNPRVRDAYLGV
jgi:ABC-type branched-subunit amino acid transport system ATPase component